MTETPGGEPRVAKPAKSTASASAAHTAQAAKPHGATPHAKPEFCAEPVLIHVEDALELDTELELDDRSHEVYTPDEPVSKSGMQYSPKNDQVDRLGSAPLGRLILEFAVPSIIGMVANGLYNIVDSVFLGLKLGEIGLATATVAAPAMILSLAVAVLVGAGGNALAAIKLGEGKREAAEHVMGNTFILAIALGILCTVLANLFLDPLLVLSGSTAANHESARVFVSIISWGFILQFLGMGFNNFIRTAGDPNRALYTMLLGIGSCVVLNYLFVMVFDWGVAGSAWATNIGMGFSTLVVLWYFVASKKSPFKLRTRFCKPSPRLLANICVLGSASFFLQVAAMLINVVLNNQLNYLGALDPIGSDGALAAIGVMMRIAMFAFFPILGVSVAIQPVLGYCYGAGLYARIKNTLKIAVVWVASFGVFFWLLVHLFPVPIVELFGVDSTLHDFTIGAIQVMMMLMPLVGVQVLVSGYFQATGQPVKSMFVSLTRQLLYLTPLLLLLPTYLPGFIAGVTPLQSIYYAYPLADAIAILTSGAMMFYEWRRITRLQAQGGQAHGEQTQGLPAS